jgi:hypothetical protein
MFPQIRHLTSYKSAISIIESGYIKTKQYDISDKEWLEERLLSEHINFKTNDLIYCTPDWFNDKKHETGHGSVMIYFKESIFNDFRITFTDSDSKIYENIIYELSDIEKIYKNIYYDRDIFNEYHDVVKDILERYDEKNEAQVFDTSNGKQYIESLYHREYSEIQIHSNQVDISYISEIVFTDIYFYKYDDDDIYRDKLIKILEKNKIKYSFNY